MDSRVTPQPIAHRAIRRPPRFVVARSAKRICWHIWNRICEIAAMLTFRALEHKSIGECFGDSPYETLVKWAFHGVCPHLVAHLVVKGNIFNGIETFC